MKKYKLKCTDGTEWDLSPFSASPFFSSNISATRSISYSNRSDLTRFRTDENAPSWTITGTIYFSNENLFYDFEDFVSSSTKEANIRNWEETASNFPISEYLKNTKKMKLVSSDGSKERFVWVELNGMTRTRKGQIVVCSVTFNCLSYWLERHEYENANAGEQGYGVASPSQFSENITKDGAVFNHGIASTAIGIEALGYWSSMTIKMIAKESTDIMSAGQLQFAWNSSTYQGASLIKVGEYENDYYTILGNPSKDTTYDDYFERSYSSISKKLRVEDSYCSKLLLPVGFNTESVKQRIDVYLDPYTGTMLNYNPKINAKYRLVWFEKYLTD